MTSVGRYIKREVAKAYILLIKMYDFMIKDPCYNDRAVYSDFNPLDGGQSLYSMGTISDLTINSFRRMLNYNSFLLSYFLYCLLINYFMKELFSFHPSPRVVATPHMA